MVVILRCRDRWGRVVALTDDQWINHIKLRHVEMRSICPDPLRMAIEQPEAVTSDRTFPDREHSYRSGVLPPPYERTYINVVVGYTQTDPEGPATGFVVTAYAVGRIHPKEVCKWP